VPSPARHEWTKRISEFVLGYGLNPTTKFQKIQCTNRRIQQFVTIWKIGNYNLTSVPEERLQHLQHACFCSRVVKTVDFQSGRANALQQARDSNTSWKNFVGAPKITIPRVAICSAILRACQNPRERAHANCHSETSRPHPVTPHRLAVA
jgi:hypothetical protein